MPFSLFLLESALKTDTLSNMNAFNDSPFSVPTSSMPQQQENTALMEIFLALYLILLAFFIVLNSFATLEDDRVDAVKEGVQKSFFDPFAASARPDADWGDSQTMMQAHVFMQEMIGLFSDEMKPLDMERQRNGRQLQVSFPVSSLFYAQRADIRSAQSVFIDRIASAVSAPPENMRYEVMIALSSGTEDDKLSSRRGSVLTQAFIDAGMPSYALSVGRSDSLTPERMRLSFVVVDAAEGRLSLGGAP